MAWPKLRKSERPVADERLQRLARRLDELPAKDRQRIEQAAAFERQQEAGAGELHELARTLAESLNHLLENAHVEITPAEFSAGALDSAAGMLIQLNLNGRIVQLHVAQREGAPSTERFATPYILHGSVRWFNQESLDRQEIRELQLFYVSGAGWRFHDPRTRRTSAFGRDQLIETLEALL